ncbi:MAG: hypothetical protein P8L66_04555 [Rhodospirillaceae bacterium]|nr:hypothetical protein [Rhodospirillaceae bacterium]
MAVDNINAGAEAVSSMLGKTYNQSLELLGEEEMTAPNGTFTVDHFRIEDTVDLYALGPGAHMLPIQ